MADDRRQLHQGPSPQCRRSGRKSGYCPHQRGLNSKLHLAVDSHGMPVRLAVTGGTVADCSLALPLIEGIEAECLLADKAYDTNEIIATARASGMNPVIPPKKQPERKAGLRPGTVQVAALGGERILGLQAVARSGDPLCQESGFIPGHLPTPGSDDLEQTLLTTPPSVFITLIHGSKDCCRGECNSVMAAAAESRPGNKVSLEIFSIASSSLSGFLYSLAIVSVQ